MSEPGSRGSRKKKGANQSHLKQRTLFDHFLVTRQTTPAPTLAQPEDLRDEEPRPQSITEQTGAPDLLEPSFAERGNDIVDSSAGVPSAQTVSDVGIEQSQERCFADPDHVPPPSSYDVTSVTSPSLAGLSLVAGSDFPQSGPYSSVSSSSSSSSSSSRRVSPLIIDLTIEEGTAKAPFIIEESPICELPTLTAMSSYTPFRPPPLGGRKQQKNHSPDAPFPNDSMQHIRDSVMDIRAVPISLARRRRRTSQSLEPDPSLPLQQATNIQKISSEHDRSYRRVRSAGYQVDADAVLSGHGALHPAISSIFGLASEQGVKEATQQYWNQKWRPRRAEHILGNEKNACYLREWMHALRLHFDAGPSSTAKRTKSRKNHKKRKRGGQRPEVVREVTRKRKKAGDLDGWIVDDGDDDDGDDDDLHGEYDGFEDLGDCSLPSSWGPQESMPISFGRKIRNTILLVGPPGCGKTAAVYACAEELGWNVFEVYPGLGKRGGTHLDDLIGDVGKNHTLPQPLLFHRGRSEPPSPVKKRSTNAVDTLGDLPKAEIHPQSAVLIEEADIVFADEAGFWPSVVAFIRSCRRPVIITCNDVSLIPVENLPLQTTLTFSLPPTSLTSPLLSAICQVEGRPSAEPKDTPGPEGQVATIDLRQRINQHHLGLTDSDCENLAQKSEAAADVIFSLRMKANIPAEMDSGQDGRKNLCLLKQSLRAADLASYLDACVLLSHPYSFEIAKCHPDDQVGYEVIVETRRTVMPVQSEHYSRDVDVATAALGSFEGVLEQCFPGMPLDDPCEIAGRLSREQYRSRLWEGLKTDPALECLVDLPRLYLDYRPLIGMMVTVEDKEIERAAEKVKGRSGRLTQNSQKRQEEDVRWLNAREELRGAVRAGGLCCSW